MRKTLLATLAVLCINNPSYAVTAATTAKTSSKSAKTTVTTPAVQQTSTKKKAASSSSTKSKTINHSKSQNKKTTRSKLHSHHHHSSIPQVKPISLAEQNALEQQPLKTAQPASLEAQTATPDTTVSATTTEATETTKQPFHLFTWHNAKEDKAKMADWTNALEQRITAFAHKTVASLHYSSYKFGGNRFDPQHGVYMLDCSSYVDNILHQTSPRAYSILAQWSGSYKPNSEHYYNFFNRLSDVEEGKSYAWNKVGNPEQLQAGDILVFRYKNSRGRSSGGHVMLVMGKPTPVGNTEIMQVRVADSAAAGHSADTRGRRASGIGIGTLLLKVNPTTGKPDAFAWRVDSPWNSRVNIAMGRPPSV